MADKEMDARTLAAAREEWLDSRRHGPPIKGLKFRIIKAEQ